MPPALFGEMGALGITLKKSLLVRNTLWMSLGQGLRIVIQATYFVVIARSLGARGYGTVVGVAAFVAIAAPFAGLGSGSVLIKQVARDRERFQEYWGRALVTTLGSGVLLLAVILPLARLIFPRAVSPLLIFSIAMSDLLCGRFVILSGQAFQAVQRLGRTTQLRVLSNLLTLSAAVTLALTTSSPTPTEWGVLLLFSNSISAVVALWLVQRDLGRPTLVLPRASSDLREGFYFSLSLSAQGIYTDVDKVLLTRLSTLEAAGIYAAAYRLIDVALTPVRALLDAAYTRFFQYGVGGIQGSLDLTRRLLPVAGIYGLLTGLALYLVAPAVPLFLGSDYQNTADALRWLAILPVLEPILLFAADTLTGADFQGQRSGVQVSVALFNGAISVVLISRYSWRGAAWASIISDAVLALLLSGLIWYLYRNQREAKQNRTGGDISYR